MADELSGAVERLRRSTEHLNHLCDQAALLIRDVEAFLEESRVGLSASVSIYFGAWAEEADSPDWENRLSYRRVDGGKFRIVYERNFIEHPTGRVDEVRPWSECTRDEKLDSLAKLPELLVELAKLAEERAIKAEKALASVGSLLRLPSKRKGS